MHLVLEDPRSRELANLAQKIALKEEAVLIIGPTGSGKEVFARLLHEQSGRRGEPFVAVNCGAIPEHLLESYFFGQARGAFSDAVEREGYLAEADNGTLFLDEIGDLPLHHQVKLLRVLDGYSYRAVGGSRERVSRTRFVAATNQDLEARSLDGRFREDLYARISKIILRVPPLRERPGDVPALAHRYASEQRPGDAGFARDVAAAASRLTAHPAAWPLGVRQVQAFVARADILGLASAEQAMRDEWERRGSPPVPAARPDALVVHAPMVTGDDRQALAGLIQGQFEPRKGKRPLAAAPGIALALADLFLGGAPVEYSRIQEVMGHCDPRTARSNLQPLLENGLLVEEGARVTLSWPPVVVRSFLRRGDDERLVQPGSIPRVHGGERMSIQVTAHLPIEVRVLVISHRDSQATEPVLVSHEPVAIGQTKSIFFRFDDAACLEQILVHLSWPKRGMAWMASEVERHSVPAPQLLKRQRMRVLEQVGPGWLQEFLVHHV